MISTLSPLVVSGVVAMIIKLKLPAMTTTLGYMLSVMTVSADFAQFTYMYVPLHNIVEEWFTCQVLSKPQIYSVKALHGPELPAAKCTNCECSRTTSVMLTHWGRVSHICVGKLTIIDSDNGSSPGRRQAIIWTNAGILLIGPWGTNSSQIVIGIQTFSFKKMHLKVSSAKWRPFCLGFNVLTHEGLSDTVRSRRSVGGMSVGQKSRYILIFAKINQIHKNYVASAHNLTRIIYVYMPLINIRHWHHNDFISPHPS